MMIWNGRLLATALSSRNPNHLQFAAIAWMPLPEPPSSQPSKILPGEGE
jgi:hypothetical protein